MVLRNWTRAEEQSSKRSLGVTRCTGLGMAGSPGSSPRRHSISRTSSSEHAVALISGTRECEEAVEPQRLARLVLAGPCVVIGSRYNDRCDAFSGPIASGEHEQDGRRDGGRE